MEHAGKKDGGKKYTVKVDSHTHAGDQVKKGDKIELTAAQANWLKEQGVV